jgi:hypothetical protein
MSVVVTNRSEYYSSGIFRGEWVSWCGQPNLNRPRSWSQISLASMLVRLLNLLLRSTESEDLESRVLELEQAAKRERVSQK